MCKAGNRIRIVVQIILVVLSVTVTPVQAEGERISGLSSGDTVTIRSSEAWEDEKPDIIHFRGDFELNTGEWQLFADQATLYGKLDDPETVVLTGTPALIFINTGPQGESRPVTGKARHIEYQRNHNRIRMTGDASLTRDESTMKGGEIEYNIDDDRFSAGGDEGVFIRVEPEDE